MVKHNYVRHLGIVHSKLEEFCKQDGFEYVHKVGVKRTYSNSANKIPTIPTTKDEPPNKSAKSTLLECYHCPNCSKQFSDIDEFVDHVTKHD